MIEKKTILIIDNAEKDRDMFEIFLEMQGYTVYFAENSRNVLPVIKEIKPDLILLDIIIPTADDLQLLEKLKKDTDLSGIPVMALTFKTASNAVVNAIRTGADEYLLKPFDADEFIAEIKKLMRLKHNQDFFKSTAQKTGKLHKAFEFQFKMRIKEAKIFQKQFELALLGAAADTRPESPADSLPKESKKTKTLITKELEFNFLI